MCRYLLSVCALSASAVLPADEPRPVLGVGDPAPEFECLDDEGQAWKSVENLGKQTMVLYFFPADFSGVCTRQAREFDRMAKRLRPLGVRVVGVSGDTVENHRAFKNHCNLDFCLLSDADGAVARAFGVPVRHGGEITRVVNGRQTVLRREVTTQRWTFVISPTGEILYKNTDVDIAADCRSVAKAIGQATASTQ